MVQINSVLGPVDTADLGFTLIHEHLLIGWAGWQWDQQAQLDGWVYEYALVSNTHTLQELRSLGVQTFVDPCPMDIGRDAEFMAEASEKSGMTIIGSTGLYHSVSGIPHYFHGLTEEQIADIFIADITEGMAGFTALGGQVIQVFGGGQFHGFQVEFG